MGSQPRVIVVGGGVSGLVAAYDLSRRGATVTLLEGATRLGGKIATVEVAGVPADTGAESLLARRPEAVRLVDELGLGERVRHPGPASPRVLSRGRLRRLPRRQVMGVPASWWDLARSRVLSPRGLLRAGTDRLRSPVADVGDVSVRELVGGRLGPDVVDRLVEPLLAGVYAGRADRLSLPATVPGLADELTRGGSLTGAAARMARRSRQAATGAPVFAGLSGGLGALVDALADRGAADIRTGWSVRELARTPNGWTVHARQVGTGAATDLEADGVLLACPPTPAARLLEREVPAAATALGGIDTASMAVVSLAYPLSAFPAPPRMSGVLVPAVEGGTVKAITLSSVKWPWIAEALRSAHPGEELVLLRCSIGRIGAEPELQVDDTELLRRAERDLARILGVRGRGVDARVTRWGGALPQYDVGHTVRVQDARTALAGHRGIEACGASFDGVGIAACVATARAAAARLTEQVGLGEPAHRTNTTGETP
ncbi:protoporphyrinogen oxidase [Spiractinospora alimapuensis]|uniref:protoporphyrinogen oxidase n=1 Tax=Spiractinospora alimapuensis TaxID=2820884 RepID=UPI001F3A1014|nr:protoporphyrinogen oxidase [Spiractinospora alimapuensis]QVQ52427.1 protoporphyrinogen oxidase [Spiractinospora alimapuensis]